MTDVITVWRCDGCGKVRGWQRRPGPHRRFFDDARNVSEAQRPYIVRVEPKWDPYRDPMIDEDGQPVEVAWVLCGPFRKFVASAVPDDPMPVPLPERVERPYEAATVLTDLDIPF